MNYVLLYIVHALCFCLQISPECIKHLLIENELAYVFISSGALTAIVQHDPCLSFEISGYLHMSQVSTGKTRLVCERNDSKILYEGIIKTRSPRTITQISPQPIAWNLEMGQTEFFMGFCSGLKGNLFKYHAIVLKKGIHNFKLWRLFLKIS